MKQLRGFTLIELVVVIIILGIMAAIAVPKFIDVSTDARTAAAKGVAGAISSGSAINMAAYAANPANAAASSIATANTCNVANLSYFMSGTGTTLQTTAATTDSAFQVAGTGGDCTLATGNASVSCTITPKSGTAATATVMCAR